MFNTLRELYIFYNYDLSTINNYIAYEKEILYIFNTNSHKDLFLSYWIGNYYREMKNYKLMRKYYYITINKHYIGYSDAMSKLGFYFYIMKDYKNMKKYYSMAIDLKNSDAMNNLGVYYQHIKNFKEMMKYYSMAIDLYHTDSMNNLGTYYYSINNFYKSKEYLLMAIENGHERAKINICIITHKLERYILYSLKNIVFNEELSDDIHIYNNKLKKSIIDQCPVCLEDNKTCILVRCFCHYICNICYIQLYNKACPVCRL